MLKLTRNMPGFIFVALFIALSAPAKALSILDAYSLALEKDPSFQAALKEKEAGAEFEEIGRAGLLPKVEFNYQNAPKNWQTATYPQTNLFGERTELTRDQQFRSYSGAVSLRQPLLDYEAYARYKVGVAQTLMADERYRGKFMDLAVRVIGSYLDVAYAKDQIKLINAQKEAYREQLRLNEQWVNAGEGTLTDMAETQARYSLVEAQDIEARDALDAAQRTLAVMIDLTLAEDQDFQELRPGKFTLAPLVPTQFDAWQEIALKNNPELSALRHGVDAAKYEVEQNRAGFVPKLELYATHTENKSDSENTVNQKYRTDSVGIRLNVPIYSGGSVASSTRQAAARYGQKQFERDVQVGNLLNDLRKQYNLCVSSRAKLTAYELAVKSATLQVASTRKSVVAGQRVNVDVLNAEQQLYSAQRDLAAAKYAYLKAWIGLLNDAGILDEKDIRRVAGYFL